MSNVDYVKSCIENNTLIEASLRDSLISMKDESLSECDAEFFKNFYFGLSGDANHTEIRNLLLHVLVMQGLQYEKTRWSN